MGVGVLGSVCVCVCVLGNVGVLGNVWVSWVMCGCVG